MQTHEKWDFCSFQQWDNLSEPSSNDSCGHKTAFETQYLDSRPSIYLKLQACLSLNILALPMESRLHLHLVTWALPAVGWICGRAARRSMRDLAVISQHPGHMTKAPSAKSKQVGLSASRPYVGHMSSISWAARLTR